MTTTAGADWELIVAENADAVLRLAYRLSGNRHDAEDIVQDTFLRAFAARDRFDGTNIGGWLHRIATNVFLDRVRRDSRFSWDRFADLAADRLPAAVVPQFGDDQLDSDIAAALAQLPAPIRVAIVLADIEGLSHEEVAAVLNVKLATVRTRLHRGRKRLAQELAHRAPLAGSVRSPRSRTARRPLAAGGRPQLA